MAIRIVCPNCQKKLNAPDTVRGKSVRCPGCETKIRVPEDAPEIAAKAPTGAAAGQDPGAKTGPQKTIPGGATPSGKLPRTTSGKQKVPAAENLADSREFLTNLNLKAVEDRNVTVCVKCGARMSEEADICPVCGVVQATGEIQEQKAKGLNTGPFYRNLFRESWRYLLENMGLVSKSELYILFGVGFACLMAIVFFWCLNLPPKVFAGVLGFFSLMMAVGWSFHLTMEVIHTALRKKLQTFRVHFDPFACIAYGLKFLLWSVVFLFPTLVLGGVLWWVMSRSGNYLAGAIIFGVLNGLVFLMFPLALAHFSMPVQGRAWVMPTMLPVFFRLLGPTLYLWLLILVAVGPALGGVIAAGAIYVPTLLPALDKLESDHTVMRAFLIAKEKSKNNPGAEPEFKEIPELNQGYVVMGILLGCAAYWAFVSVFVIRAVSIYVMTFKKPLELVAEVAEKAYVSKSDLPVKEVKAIKNPKAIGMSVAMVLSFLPILGGIIGYGFWWYLLSVAQARVYKILAMFLSEAGIPPDPIQIWIACGVGALIGMCIQFSIAGRWVAFMKFGEPGWISLIPVQNGMMVMKMAGKEPGEFFMLYIPWTRRGIMEKVAEKFDQDKSVGMGLWMFPFAYWPGLAWSDAKHIDCKIIKSKKGKGKGKGKKEQEIIDESGEKSEDEEE